MSYRKPFEFEDEDAPKMKEQPKREMPFRYAEARALVKDQFNQLEDMFKRLSMEFDELSQRLDDAKKAKDICHAALEGTAKLRDMFKSDDADDPF